MMIDGRADLHVMRREPDRALEVLEAARPVLLKMAVLPISVTCPLNTLLGMASMVTSASWPMRTFTISVSSTFTSEVTTDMSERVIKKLPVAF